MIYKHYNIATAKPDEKEREGIPHHLIDIIEPEEEFSVANFIDCARTLIKEIAERGKTPIIAGGTGLYFKVLAENYNLPRVPANKELRKELEEYAKKYGAEKLHEKLQKLDAKTAEKVHCNNVVRVIRTIEIIKALGPLSELNRKNQENEFDIDFIGLCTADRETLYQKINARVDVMLEKGLLKEAEKLFEKYGSTNSFKNTIGYQEFVPFFNNEYGFDEAVALIKQHTRNYAKRQLSLLKTIESIKWQTV